MKDTRIYVEMTDNEKHTSEWLVLVPFDEAEIKDGTNEDKDTYMQQVAMHGELCLKVKVDEGYVVTTYYYPIRRYSVTNISMYY